ncbi:MAG: cytochrome b/b6 domain-containing protein [Gemmatimonadota bacterium]|nr:MAG: cytochrome b/b6 domain-containing protein [Gemmatimonadota bacterium]
MRRAKTKKITPRDRVLRFRKSERRVHWSIAIPFLVCYTTALILVVVYNPDPLRPYREVFSWAHRISGVCLIVLPTLAAFSSVGDLRTHLYNVRQAWIWVFDDVKWLLLMGFAAISRRVSLPEQGKFNAAQKLNFMLVMTTYPLYIATGLMMWLTDATLLAWLVHFSLAVIATPFLLGHIFMATIPKDSRKAFQGMITGLVDRQWAKHHHRRWYREAFENGRRRGKRPQVAAASPNGRANGKNGADSLPLELALRRFQLDRDGGIDSLEQLWAMSQRDFQTSLMRLKDANRPEGVRLAREALEFSARNGKTALASDLFRALWPQVRGLALQRQQMREIISAFMQTQDLASAARASALTILDHRNDPLAVSCLLKTAETTLKNGEPARNAIDIYEFLLKQCPDSPYAGYFRRGLEEARSRG